MAFSNFLKPVMMLGCLLLAHTAHAERFLYTGGHSLDPVRLSMLGYSFDEFVADDAGWASALSGGQGSFKAIVVGESSGYYTLSFPTRAAIASYVSTGGRVVVVGDHSGNTAFFNSVFGYSVAASYGCRDDQNISSSLMLAAAYGTAFVSGAPTLRDLSCTDALVRTSLPSAAKSVYSGTGTSQVLTIKYGTGQLAWLGWDYCCGSASNQNDWYHVLAAAMAPKFKVCTGAGYTGAKLILCQQACEVRQTPSVKSTLIHAFNTLYRQKPSCGVDLPLEEFQEG